MQQHWCTERLLLESTKDKNIQRWLHIIFHFTREETDKYCSTPLDIM